MQFIKESWIFQRTFQCISCGCILLHNHTMKKGNANTFLKMLITQDKTAEYLDPVLLLVSFLFSNAQRWPFCLLLVLRCYLDMVKVFVFSYFFWLVLCLIFITGTTRISIFCLGYLVACFYFMLFGGSVLMQPVRYILRLWDWLIGYTCFVITMKNLLSVSWSVMKNTYIGLLSPFQQTLHNQL